MAQQSKANVQYEIATLAAGCFWGVEEILRKNPGIIDTEVGYTGGVTANPSYDMVKTGTTHHAEAIRIVFDRNIISYHEILHLFFRLHNPTTKNRQGNDLGSQYRSSIFYHDENQKMVAEQVKSEVDASGKWVSPVVTEIVAATEFFAAEEWHQDYLQKNPNGYNCHYLRD